jgi:hypothetical protein
LTPVTSILKVLSTFRRRRLKSLLMGGQACILYGGAEFSRDVDFAVAVDAGNLRRLQAALADLNAEPIYFPKLSAEALRRGHSCHFRCRARGVEGLRVDVMGRMRGAAPFGTLWRRRVRIRLPGAGIADVVGLRDLVRIKKTQRDKDWLMIRRLVESDHTRGARRPEARRVRFWLEEARSASLLLHLAAVHPRAAAQVARPAVKAALRGSSRKVEQALRCEEERERRLDRRYWAPLKRELEAWRLGRIRG